MTALTPRPGIMKIAPYVPGKDSVDGKEIDSAALVDVYAKCVEKYPICSIEDGCAEEDWAGWKAVTDAIGSKVQLVGDDLFVTNT